MGRVAGRAAFVWYALLALLALPSGGECFDLTFGDVAELLKWSRDVTEDILETYHVIKPLLPEQKTDDLFAKHFEKRLINKIGDVSHKIDVYEEKAKHRTELIIDSILSRLPRQEALEQSMHDLWKYIGQVEDSYQSFLSYAKAPANFEAYTMEEFAKNSVSSGLNALPNVIKMIHRLVAPSQRHDSLFQRSILSQLSRNMQETSSQICDTKQSPQQLLYNLYNTIAITEVKGYTMMQFSWTLLKIYNKGNFTEEVEQLKQEYAIRTSETLKAVKTAMAFAPREMWKCDPSKHVPETTYTELKQLFQGYIVNEVDLNPQGTCKENCGYYSYSKVYGCYQNQFCGQQRRCNGKIINCQYVDSDMWVCPSERNNDRRYEYIEYENGRVYGRKDTCKRSVTKVDSWWRWLFWHCSYCMCYCDDHNSISDRYFNLREVTSDIDNNKVVTGVRFKKENQIIHIQIQEGVLLPRGNINASTVSWKKIDNYTIIDGNVKPGIDYHTIMWEKRAIDLDDLDSPADHLLTGLRFRLVGAHLNLEIQITPFNFTTGQLIKEKRVWHSYDSTEASAVYINGEIRQNTKRTEFKLSKPDVPTRSMAQALPDSQTNQYMLFMPSDLEKDAAQSTVPFIDTQPVEPSPPVPISGAGIFHKGRPGYGGFLALKLITYDFQPQMRADLPSTRPVIELSNDVGR